MTSSCMHLLDMDIKKMQRVMSYGYDVQRMAPEIFDLEANSLK